MISSPYRWIILASGSLAYACSHLTRWSYTGLASSLIEDLLIRSTRVAG